MEKKESNMDAYKLGQIIERYRPLPMFDTYPIAIKINNDIKIAWFVFCILDQKEDNTIIDENDANVDILLHDFYFMDKNYNVNEIKDINIKKSTDYICFEEPELEKKDYLIKFCELINNNTITENNNKELLNKSDDFWLTDILFDEAKRLITKIYSKENEN